jgi:hypothetical protein
VKINVVGKVLIAGRVLLGPKKVQAGYARIVALKDGSGCIECFDLVSKTWLLAPQSLTFDEVWGAPVASPEPWARQIDER